MATSKSMNWKIGGLASVVSISVLLLALRSQPFLQLDVGGHNLRVLQAGDGEPTIVFENGSLTSLESWGKVQPLVSEFATTITYDRAGIGRSEDGPLPRDAYQVSKDLHTMLQNMGASTPVILVGASLGGLYVRVYASMTNRHR